ncbi:hypothetical protein QJS66_19250 [Kocuria rhizophila]|nr:hypothetical protein QJS66_19250 [Kocuria rhizophila]
MEAILNFGGLTPARTCQMVDVTYSGQIEALKTGQIDTLYQAVAPTPTKLASSTPIRWLRPGRRRARPVRHVEGLAPGGAWSAAFLAEGAGFEEDSGERAVHHPGGRPRGPAPREVASLVADIDRYYPTAKDTAGRPPLRRGQIQLTPLVIPFHDAMVEFLEGKGRWSKDLQPARTPCSSASAACTRPGPRSGRTTRTTTTLSPRARSG